jgi:hypothetical protein
VDTTASTVLWRMVRPDGGHARSVMLPGGPPHTVAFLVNDVTDRVEQFDDLALALFRADDIKRSLAGDGWTEES